MDIDMRIAALTLTASALLTAAMPAHADKTLRGRLKPNPEMVGNSAAGDSCCAAPFDTVRVVSQSDIRLSGYDKPLNSRKESLFVTNKTGRELTAVGIRLTYTDMSGRMLHEEVRFIRADIPAGDTRRVEFPSWDRQCSFYYHKGRQPRVANVTPYKVSCKVTGYVSPALGPAGGLENNQ